MDVVIIIQHYSVVRAVGSKRKSNLSLPSNSFLQVFLEGKMNKTGLKGGQKGVRTTRERVIRQRESEMQG